jgi:hypothetical protein
VDIELGQCFIAVDDHDEALAFDRDLLGPKGTRRVLGSSGQVPARQMETR